jgi:hypothetical protein
MKNYFALPIFAIIIGTSIVWSYPQQKKLHTQDYGLYESELKNDYPDEISFCIVDLKFDGSTIKICEFGEGVESKFKGYDTLFGKGCLWAYLWDFLDKFNKPIWFIDQGLSKRDHREYALHILTQHNAHPLENFQKLEALQDFKISQKHQSMNPGLSNKTGFIVARNSVMANAAATQFKKKYPTCIILGEVSNHFVRNKDTTCNLFKGTEIESFVPKFNIYECKYTPALSKKIIADLGGQTFVIKPINASLGHGIIIVEKEDLDKTLHLIFNNKKDLKPYKNDMSYYYWFKTHGAKFLVEEYAPSKIITVENKSYDPTMRVVFCLLNNAGTIYVKFFDAYWKLPSKSLEDVGSLTEKHKSHVTRSHSSAKVSDEDFELVKKHLCYVLPRAYINMFKTLFDKKQ